MTTSRAAPDDRGPAERAGLEVEPALVDALVDDVAGEPGGLPLLSTALVDLWGERDGRTLTLAAYARSGGVRGAVGRHAEAAFRSLDADDQLVARRVLLRLVGGEARRSPVGGRAAPSSTPTRTNGCRTCCRVLTERRLLVADEDSVELIHEALLQHWPRLRTWLEEDTQGRLLQLRLATAAAEWQASGARAR